MSMVADYDRVLMIADLCLIALGGCARLSVCCGRGERTRAVRWELPGALVLVLVDGYLGERV